MEHPEKDNSNLVMWVSLDANSFAWLRFAACDPVRKQSEKSHNEEMIVYYIDQYFCHERAARH